MALRVTDCHMSPYISAGHANVQTDIKEASFMGSHDDLVAAGSDDGTVFIYDAVTGQVVKILQADEDVANCVQVSVLTAVWTILFMSVVKLKQDNHAVLMYYHCDQSVLACCSFNGLGMCKPSCISSTSGALLLIQVCLWREISMDY